MRGFQKGDISCAILTQVRDTSKNLTRPKTFYLETFGCQMNVHDSEKVIGTLLHQGYSQVDTVEEAELVFYNTCSIRDKAEQKVFNRLNDYKSLLSQGKKFAVIGCVAQQEGEKIFERAARLPGRRIRILSQPAANAGPD